MPHLDPAPDREVRRGLVLTLLLGLSVLILGALGVVLTLVAVAQGVSWGRAAWVLGFSTLLLWAGAYHVKVWRAARFQSSAGVSTERRAFEE